MAKNKIGFFIQKIAVSFLIVIFALSITPVALLHDAVTNHKDVCYHNFQQKEKSISKADVNCRCISFVADVHFVSAFHPVQLCQPLFLPPVKIRFHSSQFYSQHHFFAELRGPPVLV